MRVSTIPTPYGLAAGVVLPTSFLCKRPRLRALGLALALLLSLVTGLATPARAAGDGPGCQFLFGFKVMHDALPDVVGDCLDNQSFNSLGDAVQHTTGGLLLWRKPDGQVAFTDGSSTRVMGPCGLQQRANSQRFLWETGRPGCQLASGPLVQDLASQPENTRAAAWLALSGGQTVPRAYNGNGYSLTLPPGWQVYAMADIGADFGTFVNLGPSGGHASEVMVHLSDARVFTARIAGLAPVTTPLGQPAWTAGDGRIIQGSLRWAHVDVFAWASENMRMEGQHIVDSLWVD
ncbi:MAG TPA: hypothetical protein VMW62_17365 [Chloroflexota bacterium]|nr:hypothetical protein [Chloroflexota bacterium]